MNNLEVERPNPDELLAALAKEEEKTKRGKLKIFFGMSAGVGKTYTMLQAAHIERKKGNDIVIGYVETHKRKETEALVSGFEIIPRKAIEYKSTSVEEMDLDAIIARHPQIVLVDELAHTNAPGSRHNKRYQDVQELLENGINVFTTLNVQHLESRTDTVAQITGVVIRETLPDYIFENSDDVELVDITPDELLQRLSDGKVYTPERSKEAVNNFFRKGNITALREMSLRIVADRVDNQLHDYMQDKRIRGPWKSGLHFLVAIGVSPSSAGLLRWAKNLAYSMGANVEALYVETTQRLTPKDHEQLDLNIDLAKQLGFKVRIVTNDDLVKAIVNYAQKENITHIIVGKTRYSSMKSLLKLGNFVNRLIKYSGNIDVYILGSDTPVEDKISVKSVIPPFTSHSRQYLTVSLIVALTSALSYLVRDIVGYQVVSVILLFMISLLALFYGTGPVLFAATASALVWDYFFIPPQFTLLIQKPLDILLLVMFFIIALVNGTLTSRVRRQEKKIRIREERTNALYQLTKDLNSISGFDDVIKVANDFIARYFKLECCIVVKNDLNQLEVKSFESSDINLTESEMSIVNWVEKNSLKAGKFTNTLPSNEYTFYPLIGTNATLGVIVVKQITVFTHGEEQFWESSLAQIIGKYERELLRNATKKTYMISESEKLYKTLFNSISHELRIPIATIMGSSETLLEQQLPVTIQKELYAEINIASIRLNRLVENLLNMSRLESGRITPHPDWCDAQDLINSVSESLKNELESFTFKIDIPTDLPLIYVDFGLIEQVLHNLILNATQHSPKGSVIELKIQITDEDIIIKVIDQGHGFPESELSSVFDKFYRGKDAKAGGTGLGLSIVKGFVEAHNGNVSAGNGVKGGAVFTLKIPKSK
ncbi:MAG: osmosensitive channel signal transduction histidine kinase [Bacteroidetes bacterium]|nr:osmosensitive channel signal transduction histidine kinase [Bacteroidota bacterium]